MKRTFITAAVVVVAIASAVAWLQAASATIGPNTASPGYIVVKTLTPVTFTTVIADSGLKRHDPRKVLLIKTDASGTPIDIVGRMNDRGKRADLTKNDHAYTIQTTLNETGVGQAAFKIAARFKDTVFRTKEPDDDDDWDRELTLLGSAKNNTERRDRLTNLLRRLERFTLSEPILVTVDPFRLPPDPGDAGKQTLEGIDSDSDGVRDDIQRYIAITYQQSEPTRRALTQYAVALQHTMHAGADPTTVAKEQVASVRCIAFVSAHAKGWTRVSASLRSEQLNTMDRLRTYTRLRQEAPSEPLPATRSSEDGQYCTF